MDFLMYKGKTIAVVLTCGGVQHVVSGFAELADDEDMGTVLRIQLQQQGRDLAGHPVLIVHENVLGKCLVDDDRYGCDFRLDLSPPVNPSH